MRSPSLLDLSAPGLLELAIKRLFTKMDALQVELRMMTSTTLPRVFHVQIDFEFFGNLTITRLFSRYVRISTDDSAN